VENRLSTPAHLSMYFVGIDTYSIDSMIGALTEPVIRVNRGVKVNPIILRKFAPVAK